MFVIYILLVDTARNFFWTNQKQARQSLKIWDMKVTDHSYLGSINYVTVGRDMLWLVRLHIILTTSPCTYTRYSLTVSSISHVTNRSLIKRSCKLIVNNLTRTSSIYVLPRCPKCYKPPKPFYIVFCEPALRNL